MNSRLFAHVNGLASPTHIETAAVSLTSPKTAALCFDKVWGGLDSAIPREIGFWSSTNSEQQFLRYIEQWLEADIAPVDQLLPRLENTVNFKFRSSHDYADNQCRSIAEAVSSSTNCNVVPVFQDDHAFDAAFEPGDRTAIVAILANVPVPVENGLDWQQVREIRADRTMLAHFRRLSHWLDSEMVNKPSFFIADEIAIRLENYKQALHKHGIQSALGVLSSALDSKVLVSGSAAIASLNYVGQSEWALTAGAAIVVGRVAVSIAQRLLDYRAVRIETLPEIAFLAQVQRRIETG